MEYCKASEIKRARIKVNQYIRDDGVLLVYWKDWKWFIRYGMWAYNPRYKGMHHPDTYARKWILTRMVDFEMISVTEYEGLTILEDLTKKD